MAQNANRKHRNANELRTRRRLKRVCLGKIAKTQANASLAAAANAKTNLKSESSDHKQLENHKQNQQLGDY